MIYQLRKVTREVYTRGLTIYLLKDWGLGPLLPREKLRPKDRNGTALPNLGYAIGNEVQNPWVRVSGTTLAIAPAGDWGIPQTRGLPDPLPRVDTSVEIVNVKADSKQFSFETIAPAHLLLDIKKNDTHYTQENIHQRKKSDSEIIIKRRKDSWLLLEPKWIKQTVFVTRSLFVFVITNMMKKK